MCIYGLPWWLNGKESACQCRRHRFNPWVRKIPWRRKWQPTLVFFPGESHGQRTLVGYTPWGHQRVRHDLATKQPQQNLSLNEFYHNLFLRLLSFTHLWHFARKKIFLLLFSPFQQNFVPLGSLRCILSSFKRWAQLWPLSRLHTAPCKYRNP